MKEICDIPIFHDDQHGTAVVTLAGLANALRLVGKRPDQVRVVLNGAGAAAISITKLLLTYGIKDVTLCDRTGAVYKGREQGMNAVKAEIAEITNRECRRGTLKEVIVGADVFIGVSAPGTLTEEMVASMAGMRLYLPAPILRRRFIRSRQKQQGQGLWQPAAVIIPTR